MLLVTYVLIVDLSGAGTRVERGATNHLIIVICYNTHTNILTQFNFSCDGRTCWFIWRCGYNGYGVSLSILEATQCQTSSTATNFFTATITITSVVDPVASGITVGGPGHCGTSETMLDCLHITGR